MVVMNMSYCRFENTLRGLQDCAEHLADEDLNEYEQRARKHLIEVCRDIVIEADLTKDSEGEYEAAE